MINVPFVCSGPGVVKKFFDRLTICDRSPMARSVLVGLVGLVLGHEDSRVPRFKQLELVHIRRCSALCLFDESQGLRRAPIGCEIRVRNREKASRLMRVCLQVLSATFTISVETPQADKEPVVQWAVPA